MTGNSELVKTESSFPNEADAENPMPIGNEPQSPAGDIVRAGNALLALSMANPSLAERISRVVEVVALEATRTSRFSRALDMALSEASAAASTESRKPRPSRRARGVIDPFSTYSDSGKQGLQAQLEKLDLDQLRDIVAEHGMDHDRLAMKWKDLTRLRERIVERVEARAAKGSAFRGRPGPGSTHPAPARAQDDRIDPLREAGALQGVDSGAQGGDPLGQGPA
ncbi:hypothetical protein ACIQF6_26655 [Kitasatospora sp. NPDC092948]|uniref:hypothetical protein n=1 Tax=Kitasatospora sp. NPDC092948 TaxID=3364088 RepID=UPI003806A7DC